MVLFFIRISPSFPVINVLLETFGIIGGIFINSSISVWLFILIGFDAFDGIGGGAFFNESGDWDDYSDDDDDGDDNDDGGFSNGEDGFFYHDGDNKKLMKIT